MKIRLAKPEDIGEVVEIYNQAILAGEKTGDLSPVSIADRKKWFEEHNPKIHPLLIAEENKKIIGYLTISPYRPGRMALRHTAEVSYYIHFGHHRKGVASRLLEYAINLCPSLGIRTLFAIIIDTNFGSVKLLEKYGFEKWGHLPRVADFDGKEVGHLYYGLRMK